MNINLDDNRALFKQQPLSFDKYRIYTVLNKLDQSTTNQIINLWQRNNILPANVDPYDRVRQVVLAVKDTDDKVIAVNTAYSDKLSSSGLIGPVDEYFYYYRMFIEKSARIPELMRIMTNTAFDSLKHNTQNQNIKGMIIITDNMKLTRPGMLKMFSEHGYNVIGKQPSGKLIIQRLF